MRLKPTDIMPSHMRAYICPNPNCAKPERRFVRAIVSVTTDAPYCSIDCKRTHVQTYTCLNCGKEFSSTSKKSKFCRKGCNEAHRNKSRPQGTQGKPITQESRDLTATIQRLRGDGLTYAEIGRRLTPPLTKAAVYVRLTRARAD